MIALEGFLAHQQRTGAVDGLVTAAQLGKTFVASYGRYRHGQGAALATVERELATLRAAVDWAAEDELITTKPHIPKLQVDPRRRVQSRSVAYTLPQLAAVLEAAWSIADRRHVHLFIVAMLASHARAEAILECDLDLQHQDGVIDWLGADRGQTKKRRAMVPVGPTFAAWLEGRHGKLIRYRSELAPRRWLDPEVPEFIERPTFDIHTAFESTLLAAGAAHPSLKLRRPVLDAGGNQVVQIRKVRERGRWVDGDAVPQWEGVGSPNSIRHSIHTQLKRIGVPKGQIDQAAGHAEQGTGRFYNHFDALEDLKDLTAGIEQLFDELRRYTMVHLRTHCGPNVIDLAQFRPATGT